MVFSPAGFARGPVERAYVRTFLRSYHAAASAVLPVVDRVLGAAPARTLLAAPVFLRGDRVPADVLAGRAREYAGSRDAFHATFPAAIDTPVTCEPEDVPVTVAWGVFDLLLPYAIHGRRARRILPGARHVRLDAAGHIPMFDQPERCAELLLDTRVTEVRHPSRSATGGAAL